MAPSTCQPATSRCRSSLDQVRKPLARLTINPRQKLHADRVSKPTSSKPAKRSTMSQDAMIRSLRARTRSLDLNSHELNCAQAIFNKLRTIPGVASRSPCLFDRGSDIYELVNPNYDLRGLRGPHLTRLCSRSKLSAERVRSLLDNLPGDIDKLYNAHIAYVPDIKTLLIATNQKNGTLWPFIDTFDFSKHVDDQAVPWEDLKKKTMEIVKSQFYVIEQLATLKDGQSSFPGFVEFQPDSVVEVLKTSGAPEPQQHLIIRYVNRYSPKLGQFVNEYVGWLIGSLHSRTGPADESRVRDGLSSVSHTLELLDQHFKDRQIEHGDLVARVKLRMLYTVLLTTLHAKKIPAGSGRGLLRYIELVADSYTSYEGFQSVANAYSQLEDAIRHLEEKGDYSWHLFYRKRVECQVMSLRLCLPLDRGSMGSQGQARRTTKRPN